MTQSNPSTVNAIGCRASRVRSEDAVTPTLWRWDGAPLVRGPTARLSAIRLGRLGMQRRFDAVP
jgi:hypothetical protein